MHLRRDLQSAMYYMRRGELSVVDWVRTLRGPKAYALFSWSDPGPFVSDLRRVSGKVLRMIVASVTGRVGSRRDRGRAEADELHRAGSDS